MENKEMTSTIIYVLAGVLLAFLINAGMGLALGTDLPIVAVQSDSMVPTFYKGDMLLLQGVSSKESVQIGDIIVFTAAEKGTPIVHRVIRLNDDGTFQTKGDANTGQLPFETNIRLENIHGKVMFIVPYLGWVKIGLTEYAMPFLINNIAMIIVFVIALIIIYYKFGGST